MIVWLMEQLPENFESIFLRDDQTEIGFCDSLSIGMVDA